MTWDNTFKARLTCESTLSAATIDQHVSRVRNFAAWMKANVTTSEYLTGNLERIKVYGLPSAANSDIIRKYFENIAGKYPSDYRQHIKAALKHYYTSIIAGGGLKEMPSLDVPIRRNGTDRGKEMNVLSDDDVATLRTHFKGVRDILIFQCLTELGIRKGELLMLRFEDFKPNNQVSFRSTKTEGKSKYGGPRIMPLSDRLYELVKEYKKAANLPEGPVFHITGHTVWRIVKDAGLALDMPWLKPHAFRHYCITKFSQLVGSDGVSPIFNWKELSVMFGVSPEIIAQRYDHPDPKNIVSKALKSGVYSDA